MSSPPGSQRFCSKCRKKKDPAEFPVAPLGRAPYKICKECQQRNRRRQPQSQPRRPLADVTNVVANSAAPEAGPSGRLRESAAPTTPLRVQPNASPSQIVPQRRPRAESRLPEAQSAPTVRRRARVQLRPILPAAFLPASGICEQERFDIGPMDFPCSHCGAFKWAQEKTNCCKQGGMEMDSFPEPPRFLKRLLLGISSFFPRFDVLRLLTSWV